MSGRWSAAVTLSAALAASAAVSWSTAGSAKVSFSGKGPAGFKLVGTTEELVLEDKGEQLLAKVPLDTLKTGIDLRDRHMREKYLETGKFPFATLVVDKATLKLPEADGQTVQAKGKGQFTVHGVTREQAFAYTAQRAGGVDQITATFRTNFRDHGVSVPSYLGITVKPEIDVEVSFGLKR